MGPIWGPPGANKTQVGPMWTTWTLLYLSSFNGLGKHSCKTKQETLKFGDFILEVWVILQWCLAGSFSKHHVTLIFYSHNKFQVATSFSESQLAWFTKIFDIRKFIQFPQYLISFGNPKYNVAYKVALLLYAILNHIVPHYRFEFSKISYPETSNISHIKFQKINVSRLILQLSLPNPLKPGVKSRMKM